MLARSILVSLLVFMTNPCPGQYQPPIFEVGRILMPGDPDYEAVRTRREVEKLRADQKKAGESDLTPWVAVAIGIGFVPILVGVFILISRAGKHRDLSAPSPNPNLMACPDCGRLASRLAPTCPQCGRPLIDAGPKIM